MKPIAPNTLIQNRYLIVHLIGKGGMGEVYLAVDQRLGSAIALKRTFFSDDATLGHAFEREARTLARLRHPVLPKVSDHFTEEGTQYLVMEHISGEDMSKRLETSQQAFPISWVLFWADQLLDSLNYLHSHEPPIIHRDIKPQNLKLTDENHIVLLDFGLSKNSVGETRATTGGSIVGYTPHYASMEQIRGTGTDARSDLYSLSATLYQILTNDVPPDALTRADSLINGMPDPIKPISDLNPEVSRAVSDVIIKGMHISQDQRYKTAREMQKALRDAYAQMQTDMSANTIAFANPAQSQTADAALPLVSQVPPQMPTQPNFDLNATAAEIHASVAPKANNTEPNFDQTIRYDSEVPPPAAKQADIKTEVFLAGSSPAITAVQEESRTANNFPNGDSYSKGDSFSEKEAEVEDFSPPENYSPNATVPLFTFDKETANGGAAETALGFDSLSKGDDNKTSAGATYVPADNSYAPNGGETFTPSAAVVAAPKKSGKGLAIVGGIFALLILAGAAAGIGWFMMRDKPATTDNVTPTPTTEASVQVTPSVSPTLEVVSGTNTSTDAGTNTLVNAPTNTSTSTNNVAGTVNTTRTTQPTGGGTVKGPGQTTTGTKGPGQTTTGPKDGTATGGGKNTGKTKSSGKSTDIEQ